MDALSDDTKRWTTTTPFLEAEREHALQARAESSALRRRPPPPPSAALSGRQRVGPLLPARPAFTEAAAQEHPAGYVDPARVRHLYDAYMRVVGPVAKAVFESELRALRRLPSTLTARDCDFLVERLTSRIPLTTARARFLAAAHDVFS